MLLARLQRQHVAFLNAAVGRAADDAPGDAPLVLVAAGQEAQQRAAPGGRDAEGLGLAHAQFGAVLARRLQQRQADRVDRRDDRGARRPGQRREVVDRLEQAQVVRVGHDEAGGRLAVQRPLQRVQVGRAAGARRDLADGDARPAHRGAHDARPARVERRRQQHQRPPLRAHRDVAGLGERRGAVVHARVGDGQARQAADERLPLVDGLQRALRDLGLVRRVGGQELAARDQRVDRGRDDAVVDAAAQEADQLALPVVGAGGAAEPVAHLLLAQAEGQVQVAVQPDVRRQVGEQLLDAVQPHRRQHLADVLIRVRDVGHVGISLPAVARRRRRRAGRPVRRARSA